VAAVLSTGRNGAELIRGYISTASPERTQHALLVRLPCKGALSLVPFLTPISSSNMRVSMRGEVCIGAASILS
jgi:hypothetical protein